MGLTTQGLLMTVTCVVTVVSSGHTVPPRGNVLNTIILLGDKVARATDAINNSSRPFCIGDALRQMPAESVQELERQMRLADIQHTIVPVTSSADDTVTNAVLWAQQYIEAHPDMVQATTDCFRANITAGVMEAGNGKDSRDGSGEEKKNKNQQHENSAHGCDVLRHLENVIFDFAHLGEKDVMGLHGGRPAAYNLGQSVGIRNDVAKFGFWFALLLVFSSTSPTIGAPLLTTLYSNLAHLSKAATAPSHSSNQQAMAEAEETTASNERWRTIMYVFPSFTEFHRAMKHDPDFNSLLRDMCSVQARGVEGLFDRGVLKADGANEFENCWARKKEVAFHDVGMVTSYMRQAFLGIPLIPQFLVTAFAIILLIRRTSVDSATCSITWPRVKESTDWECTNSNHDGSVCIIQCLNQGSNIRKIVWGLSNVRVCDKGIWRPGEDDLSACAQINADHFDYGISRMTPEV